MACPPREARRSDSINRTSPGILRFWRVVLVGFVYFSLHQPYLFPLLCDGSGLAVP